MLMMWPQKRMYSSKCVPLSQSWQHSSSVIPRGCRYIYLETIPAAQSLIKQLVDNYFIYPLLFSDTYSHGFQAQMHKLEMMVVVYYMVTRKYIVCSVKCIGDDSFLPLGCLFSGRTSQDKGEAHPLESAFQGGRKKNYPMTLWRNVFFSPYCISFRILCLQGFQIIT